MTYNYDFCSICGRFGNMANHICPALWRVRAEDWDSDDYSEVRADTAKEAACDFAEQDLADSAVMGEGEWTVFVEPVLDPEGWQPFQVNMEMQPVFNAQALKEAS